MCEFLLSRLVGKPIVMYICVKKSPSLRYLILTGNPSSVTQILQLVSMFSSVSTVSLCYPI